MTKLIGRYFVALMVIGSILFVALLVFWGFQSWGIFFVQNFGSNWLATLLGVIIGLPLAFWANNYQEQATQRQRKWKILKSLFNELGYYKIELDRWVDQDLIRTESGTVSSVLLNEIWNTFSDGGELEWIKDGRLLAQISKPGGGYIFCTSHNIQADTPIPNNIALMKAYLEYAKY